MYLTVTRVIQLQLKGAHAVRGESRTRVCKAERDASTVIYINKLLFSPYNVHRDSTATSKARQIQFQNAQPLNVPHVKSIENVNVHGKGQKVQMLEEVSLTRSKYVLQS